MRFYIYIFLGDPECLGEYMYRVRDNVRPDKAAV